MARPIVSALGWVTCLPSLLVPKPITSARMGAPRACAWESSSSTIVQAPSPSTRPSRAASNGRGVTSGASLRTLVANSVSNTAASMACSSSEPPASMATCLPDWIVSKA